MYVCVCVCVKGSHPRSSACSRERHDGRSWGTEEATDSSSCLTLGERPISHWSTMYSQPELRVVEEEERRGEGRGEVRRGL